MTYFRRLVHETEKLADLLYREDRWLILINADPDAMASAMALKRIMARRVEAVGIAHVNEIKRPDNLAMIRYLRVPTARLTPDIARQYHRFALVDSQPQHHPDFQPFPFCVVIDHHPVDPKYPVKAAFADIRPDYGATSTILTEYLYNLHIRPGKLLATALAYGIKADTQSFERGFLEADVKAFSYLSKCANMLLVRKIVSSEFNRSWLRFLSKAFRKMRFVGSRGLFVYMDVLESPDILVVLADFFTKVHGFSWITVCGLVQKSTLVVVFRGDGIGRNLGKTADEIFGDVGSAGGHKTAARAEISLAVLKGKDPEEFLYRRLTGKRLPAKAEACPPKPCILPAPKAGR